MSDDKEADRLMALLDCAIAAIRSGDGDAMQLACAELEKTAKRLQEK